MSDDPRDDTLRDSDDFVDVCVGYAEWQLPDGTYILEKDYPVSGEVWRVHKNDPDPFPSKPHAHCIAGRQRFVGCKLHLGTGELFRGKESLGRRLSKEKFERLVAMIQPKFPGIQLPLRS